MEHTQVFNDFRNADLSCFGALKEAEERYTSAPAIGFFGRTVSYTKLISRIEATARALLSAGVKPGDAVTFMLPNCPQAVEVFYAISRLGAVANMIHTLSSAEEIAYYLKKADSRFVVTLDGFVPRVREGAKNVPGVKIIFTALSRDMPLLTKVGYAIKNRRNLPEKPVGNDVLRLESLERAGEKLPLPEAAYEKDRTAVILYSGGSTGMPKGVCLTDFNMNSLGVQVADSVGYKIRPGQKFLSAMPLFHGFGLGVGIHAFICAGAECVLVPQFTLDAYVKTLLKEKTNMLAIVPSMLQAFLRTDAFDGKDLSFLLGVYAGADATPIPLQEKMNAFLKAHGANVEVREGYGMTETVTACVLNPIDHVKPGSVGIPMGQTKCRIVKPGTFEDLPVGEKGELLLAGPCVMQGYLNDPEATAKTIREDGGERWVFTGDLCYFDADGYLYFVQRLKRLIISNGYNISPGQVETVASEVKGVAAACAVGVKDKLTGQKVVVCVVPVPGTDEKSLKKDVMEACRSRLAAYAVPQKIVFMPAFPLTKMGKIDFGTLEKEMNEREEKKHV